MQGSSFPDQGLNPWPLHSKSGVFPLDHQGSPHFSHFYTALCYLPHLFTVGQTSEMLCKAKHPRKDLLSSLSKSYPQFAHGPPLHSTLITATSSAPVLPSLGTIRTWLYPHQVPHEVICFKVLSASGTANKQGGHAGHLRTTNLCPLSRLGDTLSLPSCSPGSSSTLRNPHSRQSPHDLSLHKTKEEGLPTALNLHIYLKRERQNA